MEVLKNTKKLRALFAAALVPFITACNGGGGGGSALLGVGSLFSGTGGGGEAGPGLLPGGDQVASLTNPEPASMLLVGSGMAAMAYFNRKRKQ